MVNALAKYDAMCRAIDAAYKVDEVKAVRDTAVALEHYARQAHNTEAERQACEIRLRAERKAGQLLSKMEKAKGARGIGKKVESRNATPLLTDFRITKNQSAQWQKLGAVSQRDFDDALEQSDKPTTSGIIRATAPPKPKLTPVSAPALWLWGRLRDFRDNGMLDQSPEEVMTTMTPEMKDDVHTIAPRVSAWLKRIGALS